MDFIEELRKLSVSINDQTDLIQTEAATKTVCVLPFIDLLGYDTHNLRACLKSPFG